MDKHDELCEKADVGSLCDCHCAGAKHAIKHTKGGVPGAGAVTRAAQKAASADGRASVINNRATPKDGARVAPGAPKTFKDAQAAAGDGFTTKPGSSYLVHDSGVQIRKDPLGGYRVMTPHAKPGQGPSHDEVHHADTLQEARAAGQKEADRLAGGGRKAGDLGPVSSAGGGKPGPIKVDASKGPVSRAAFDAAKTRAKAADSKPGGPVRDTTDYTDRVKPAGPYAEEMDKTKKVFDGTGAELVNTANTSAGDRVTHRTKGQGTVKKVGRNGDPHTVAYDSGTSGADFGHNLVKGEHGDKVPDAPKAKGKRLQLKPGALQLSGQAPDAGTRVVHELHGPGTITKKGHASHLASVKFDNPASGTRIVERHSIFDAKDVITHDGKPVPGNAPTAAKAAGEVRDTTDYTDRVEPTGPYKSVLDDTKRKFAGTGAEIVGAHNTKVGDRVTHQSRGVGTVQSVGRNGNSHDVKFDNTGKVEPQFGISMVHGEHGDKVPVGPLGPGSNLSTMSPQQLRKALDDLDAKVRPQGGLTGPQADVRQNLRRELDRRDNAGVTGAGQGGVDAARRDLMAVTSRRRNGDTVTESRSKPAAGGAGRDKTERVQTRQGDGSVSDTAKPGSGGYTPEQARQRDQARDSQLGTSQGRRARVDQFAGISKDYFDKMPQAEQDRALADLRRIADSGDVRSTRDQHGIAGKADQNHVGRAKDLLRRFTTAPKAAEPAKAPVADRFDAEVKAGRVYVGGGTVDAFFKGMGREDLVALAEAKGWASGKDAKTWKLAYLRKAVTLDAIAALRKR